MRDAVPHHTIPDVFRDALTRTAQEEGFNALLVEKDYFCSLVLREVGRAKAAGSSPLVFKGGTALSKIHMGFHRLSEDLDFVVPAAVEATRGTRRRLAGPLAVQLDSQLRPVLRPADYAGFDLDRSVALVRQVLEALGGRVGKTAPQP